MFTIFPLSSALEMFPEITEADVVWSEVYFDKSCLDKAENENLEIVSFTPADLLETIVKFKADIPVKRKTKSPLVEFDSQVPVTAHPTDTMKIQ